MSTIPEALNDSLKLFDWRFYLEVNHDIADLGIITEEQARDHYIRYGYNQHRWMNASLIPSNEGCMQAMDVIMTIPMYNIICPEIENLNERLKVFDWQFYLVASPDLKQLGVTTKEAALNHFKSFGYSERRWINASEPPSLNDCLRAEASIDSHPKISSACPHVKHHSIAREGHDTSSSKASSSSSLSHGRNLKLSHVLKVFDWNFYLKYNPDLVTAGITNEAMALDHFTKYGIHEHRWGSPKVKPSLSACLRAKAVISANPEYLSYCTGRTFEDNACDKDDELEALVTTSPTRTMHYIISHDNSSTHVADAYGKCRDWIHNIKFGPSKYFESEVYNYLLEHSSLLLHYDYILISTYKTIEMVASELKAYLNHAKENSYECIPFLRSHATFIDQFRHRHGAAIIKTWDLLLQKLGYSLKSIREFDQAKPFYRSTFLIKPDVLLKLSSLMQKAMTLTSKDKVLRKAFAKDAQYVNGTAEQALKSFGTPYYQYHPFIFERLPVFFLYSMGTKVCINEPTGPCAANTEFFHFQGKKLVIDEK